MTQYIDKSALVAEIERRIKKPPTIDVGDNKELCALYGAKCHALNSVLTFIDTLKVKEVDLEKEFDNYTKNILACDVQFEPFTHLYNCAKYFFELGLKVQKGESKKELDVCGSQDCDAAKQIFRLFPKLCESEDERIRKEIIKTVELYGPKTGDPKVYNDMLVWLEKQGEQKPIEWRQDNVEELTEFECAMMHIGGSFFGKNAGLDPNDTTVVKEQAKLLTEMLPKQEWSKEDEEMLKSIMATCELAEQERDSSPARHLLEMQLDWLKSLKKGRCGMVRKDNEPNNRTYG